MGAATAGPYSPIERVEGRCATLGFWLIMAEAPSTSKLRTTVHSPSGASAVARVRRAPQASQKWASGRLSRLQLGQFTREV